MQSPGSILCFTYKRHFINSDFYVMTEKLRQVAVNVFQDYDILIFKVIPPPPPSRLQVVGKILAFIQVIGKNLLSIPGASCSQSPTAEPGSSDHTCFFSNSSVVNRFMFPQQSTSIDGSVLLKSPNLALSTASSYGLFSLLCRLLPTAR